MSNNVAKSKLEFDVRMTCDSCADSVRKALEKNNIRDFEIDVKNEQVIVETELPYTVVLNALESSGRPAALKGYGSSAGQSHETAVCELKQPNGIVGVVRFLQLDDSNCIVDGTIDGLTEKRCRLAVHEFGDLTNGCDRVGDVYNPDRLEEPAGDLGEIIAENNGRSMFRKEIAATRISDVIGRSLVVSDGNLRLGCGIIARSAGLFQNPKRICQCDGKTIWEERAQAKSKY